MSDTNYSTPISNKNHYSASFSKHVNIMMILTKIAQEVLISGKEMPIITLLTYKDNIISITYNKTNENKNGIHHGEYLAFKSLPIEFVKNHIADVTLYVNVEPCIMCESMIQQMGVKKVVFSCENDRFGASLLPQRVKSKDTLQLIPYIFRKEAIITLRQFYLQENKNAPKKRRKEGRALDLKTFPDLKWNSYFSTFDTFYKTIFDTKTISVEEAEKIYEENLDLEQLNMDLIKLKANEDDEITENQIVLESVESQVKQFWNDWKETKKRKN